jgi:hypothetical protein
MKTVCVLVFALATGLFLLVMPWQSFSTVPNMELRVSTLERQVATLQKDRDRIFNTIGLGPEAPNLGQIKAPGK